MAQPSNEHRRASEPGAARDGEVTEVAPRARRRIWVGVIVGPVIGLVVGAAIALAFGAPAWGVGAAAIGGAIFGALGAFWGGLSSLRPPASQDDPLEAGAEPGSATDERSLTVRRDPR